MHWPRPCDGQTAIHSGASWLQAIMMSLLNWLLCNPTRQIQTSLVQHVAVPITPAVASYRQVCCSMGGERRRLPMDTDSTMTVFEYDINPFNDPRIPGNVVDGNPFSDLAANGDPEIDRGIVIGLERPELLITETLAVHDRQLSDVNTDPSGDTTAGGDDDWDSPRVPNSAAYIELYHPWRQPFGAADSFQTLPRELTTNPSANPTGVDLNKLAPPVNSGDAGTPVWRIVAHRGENATNPNQAVRSIYFVDPIGLRCGHRRRCILPNCRNIWFGQPRRVRRDRFAWQCRQSKHVYFRASDNHGG